MQFNWLKPTWLNILVTLGVLALPLFKERVPLEAGKFAVERYQPIVLLGVYIWTLDWQPIFLMLGYCLLVYIVVSGAIFLFRCIAKK